jgi:hypothetical protein
LPRIAALLELADDVIGDCVSLLLCEVLLQAANDLVSPPQAKATAYLSTLPLVTPDENTTGTIVKPPTLVGHSEICNNAPYFEHGDLPHSPPAAFVGCACA